MEEMMDDAFESALGDEDEEEAAEAEVDKILFEVTNGKVWFVSAKKSTFLTSA